MSPNVANMWKMLYMHVCSIHAYVDVLHVCCAISAGIECNAMRWQMTATLARLKKLCAAGATIHANVYSVMERWMEGIRKVQARRKEEIVSTANRNHSTTPRPQNDKGS